MKKDYERLGQYATRRLADCIARRETSQTGRPHEVILTRCYRDGGLTEETCWTVVCSRGGK